MIALILSDRYVCRQAESLSQTEWLFSERNCEKLSQFNNHPSHGNSSRLLCIINWLTKPDSEDQSFQRSSSGFENLLKKNIIYNKHQLSHKKFLFWINFQFFYKIYEKAENIFASKSSFLGSIKYNQTENGYNNFSFIIPFNQCLEKWVNW